jgi:hypothetical protein
MLFDRMPKQCLNIQFTEKHIFDFYVDFLFVKKIDTCVHKLDKKSTFASYLFDPE